MKFWALLSRSIKMVTIRNIRKIPQAMLDKIKMIDNAYYEKPDGHTRFYKYYTLFKNELCEVIVAVRHYYKKWYCKQVIVHGIHNKNVCLRDIARFMGFPVVGWFRDGISKYEHYQDYDWGYNDDKYFYLYAPIVNKEFITTLPEYKYSAVDLYLDNNIFKYLRFYEQYPQTELLVKAGLQSLATSKVILRQCAKDKQFCKWLYQHKSEIQSHYYVNSIIRAYKQSRDIKEVYAFDNFKKYFDQPSNFIHLKEIFNGKEKQKFLDYLIKQKTDGNCYADYLEACEYLQLDMNLDKNRYPHDFKRWHDIRIDEYHSAKAKADAKARRKLYRQFSKVSNKYLGLQHDKNDFVIVIAKSPAELVNEGNTLHHCVGRMGYDQKFARGESLIFFVRNKDSIETPFVTLEYSPTQHKVLQCYADHDTKPDDNVLNFVNKIWLPYANRKIKKIA